MSFETIYVFLPDEGVDTWRPVLAEHVRDNVYRIADQRQPDDEVWEFRPGAVVVCEYRELSGGGVLVAARSLER